MYAITGPIYTTSARARQWALANTLWSQHAPSSTSVASLSMPGALLFIMLLTVRCGAQPPRPPVQEPVWEQPWCKTAAIAQAREMQAADRQASAGTAPSMMRGH